METLVYSIKIHAPQQKVWDVLWTLDSYQAWTKFFSPSSTMQSDWKVDGKTYFLDGEGNGMISSAIQKLQGVHISPLYLSDQYNLEAFELLTKSFHCKH